MWKLTEYKSTDAKKETKVKLLVKEMAANTFASYAEQFADAFKIRLAEIPRQNNFSADLLYKCTQRNMYSVEIWKLDVAGEFKYRMFTLDYQKENK